MKCDICNREVTGDARVAEVTIGYETAGRVDADEAEFDPSFDEYFCSNCINAIDKTIEDLIASGKSFPNPDAFTDIREWWF